MPIRHRRLRPAGACVQSFKTEAGARKSARDVVLVACPGRTAFEVKQPAVHRISKTCRYAWNEIRPRCDKCRVAGNTQWERDPRAAFHGCTGCGTLDPDDPVGGELVIATDLSADYGPGRAEVDRGDAGCDGSRRNRVMYKLYRVGDVRSGTLLDVRERGARHYRRRRNRQGYATNQFIGAFVCVFLQRCPPPHRSPVHRAQPRLAFRVLLLAMAFVLLVPYALVPLYRAVDLVSTLMLWRWAKRACSRRGTRGPAGNKQSLTFTSQYGTVSVSNLPIVSVDDVPSNAPEPHLAPGPAPEPHLAPGPAPHPSRTVPRLPRKPTFSPRSSGWPTCSKKAARSSAHRRSGVGST
jgi:hypothetical protein